MSDEVLMLPDGTQVGTGLLVPASRPVRFQPLSDAVPLLTMAQIQMLTTSGTSTPARVRFRPEIFIKNQGGRGSCNGYAGAKALERARVLRGLPHIPLSGEGLYAQINGGRDQGSMLDDGMEAIQKTGVPPEDLVPAEEYLWSRISAEAKAACADNKAIECYRVDTEDELATGLALGFVGVVAVHANNAFMRLDSNGVVSPADGPGNHAVGVQDVRVVNNEYQFDMFNSWGLSYGNQGHGWLTWKRHFRTTIQYHAFYLIRSTTDGKDSA